MKHIFTLLLAVVTIAAQTKTAAAYSVPQFPSCTNPEGNIKVEYVDGQHAIVGENYLRSGEDKVYSLFDGNILQCFCPINGEGIQTNWWKINSLTQEDIDTLKKQGWHFIPSGRDWGLDAEPYLAKNTAYDCKPDSSDDKKEESSGIGGGEVLSSFAPTGDSWFIFIALLFGVSLVLAAFSLRKK